MGIILNTMSWRREACLSSEAVSLGLIAGFVVAIGLLILKAA